MCTPKQSSYRIHNRHEEKKKLAELLRFAPFSAAWVNYRAGFCAVRQQNEMIYGWQLDTRFCSHKIIIVYYKNKRPLKPNKQIHHYRVYFFASLPLMFLNLRAFCCSSLFIVLK